MDGGLEKFDQVQGGRGMGYKGGIMGNESLN